MGMHVSIICSSAHFQLWQLRKIRPYLSVNACKSAVRSLVTSRLDYTCSLLVGLPEYLFDRLQLVQNSAARLISQCDSRAHISPIISDFHWLRVRQRVRFRLCVYMFKINHGLAPQYV